MCSYALYYGARAISDLSPMSYSDLMLGPTIFLGKWPRELAAALEEALYRFRQEIDHLRHIPPHRPRPDLRGVEWLALAVAVLFLELIWLSSRF
jgi:hypothetical protein